MVGFDGKDALPNEGPFGIDQPSPRTIDASQRFEASREEESSRINPRRRDLVVTKGVRQDTVPTRDRRMRWLWTGLHCCVQPRFVGDVVARDPSAPLRWTASKRNWGLVPAGGPGVLASLVARLCYG